MAKCKQICNVCDLYMWSLYDQAYDHPHVRTVCSPQRLSVDHLWHVVLVLSAIRQGEDRHELLEKTLLKLRVDQKGNRSTMCLYVCNDCAQKQENKKDENEQADWIQLQMLCWHWTFLRRTFSVILLKKKSRSVFSPKLELSSVLVELNWGSVIM